MTDAIAIKGAPASPYTRKMLALLRYRRIPYRFLIGTNTPLPGYPSPKVELLPNLYLPGRDGQLEAVVDSTPIIRRLERERPGRSVIPDDPALRFLDELLEDFADEWLTKAMFHYRWRYAPDIDKAGTVLPRWRDMTGSPEALARAKAQFSERQIGRLHVVGSHDGTAALIEDGYRRTLDLLEAHLARHRFLMGARPGASDFAAYGQLTQLTHFDPTPMAIAVERAPGVYAWVDLVEDLSGLEPQSQDWLPTDPLPDTLMALLGELARGYVPVMLANAAALTQGADRVETEIDGRPWTQQPFPYQGKCVQWLRESYRGLPDDARSRVRDWLGRAGCLPLVEPMTRP